jgi:hypothetical protein
MNNTIVNNLELLLGFDYIGLIEQFESQKGELNECPICNIKFHLPMDYFVIIPEELTYLQFSEENKPCPRCCIEYVEGKKIDEINMEAYSLKMSREDWADYFEHRNEVNAEIKAKVKAFKKNDLDELYLLKKMKKNHGQIKMEL